MNFLQWKSNASKQISFLLNIYWVYHSCSVDTSCLKIKCVLISSSQPSYFFTNICSYLPEHTSKLIHWSSLYLDSVTKFVTLSVGDNFSNFPRNINSYRLLAAILNVVVDLAVATAAVAVVVFILSKLDIYHIFIFRKLCTAFGV